MRADDGILAMVGNSFFLNTLRRLSAGSAGSPVRASGRWAGATGRVGGISGKFGADCTALAMAALDFKLAFLVVGVWAAFVMFGIAQEGLTRTKFGADGDNEGEQFKFTTFLVLLQSIGNSAVAAVLLVLSCVYTQAPAIQLHVSS